MLQIIFAAPGDIRIHAVAPNADDSPTLERGTSPGIREEASIQSAALAWVRHQLQDVDQQLTRQLQLMLKNLGLEL